MQETFEINVVSRSDGGKGASRRLRREGLVPGIIYGGGKAPEMIATRHNELAHQLENEAFYSHILQVNLNGTSQKVVLKDLQRHPAKPFAMHFDLLRVAARDRIKMNIPLHFLGEETAPVVKTGGGKFSHNLTDIEIVCEAQDLPEYIEIDVSHMELGDMIHISDLQLPEGVESVALSQGADHDALVVTVTSALQAEEAEEAEEAGEAADVEVSDEEESGEDED